MELIREQRVGCCSGQGCLGGECVTGSLDGRGRVDPGVRFSFSLLDPFFLPYCPQEASLESSSLLCRHQRVNEGESEARRCSPSFDKS